MVIEATVEWLELLGSSSKSGTIGTKRLEEEMESTELESA